jgi:hypothetical protein
MAEREPGQEPDPTQTTALGIVQQLVGNMVEAKRRVDLLDKDPRRNYGRSTSQAEWQREITDAEITRIETRAGVTVTAHVLGELGISAPEGQSWASVADNILDEQDPLADWVGLHTTIQRQVGEL